MTSDLQKEAATCASMSSRYKKIAEVFDLLPERFKLSDLMRLANIKDGPQQRVSIGAVLCRDFKCTNVVDGPKRCWKKS